MAVAPPNPIRIAFGRKPLYTADVPSSRHISASDCSVFRYFSVLVHRSEVPDPDTGKRDLHNVERCVETRGEYRADETAAERLHRRLELR